MVLLGKKSKSEDFSNPDWVPSLYLDIEQCLFNVTNSAEKTLPEDESEPKKVCQYKCQHK